MGYDCINYLPKGTRRNDVNGFLLLLGYKKQNKNVYFWFSEEHYQSFSGVLAKVVSAETNDLEVWTHSWIFRSKSDAEYHNHTIRQIKKRFGGYFVSDYGRNRYLPIDEEEYEPAEAGCGLAYEKFGHNIIRMKVYIDAREFKGEQWAKIGKFEFIDYLNPKLLSNNLLVPVMVASLEDYFKSTFVALLRYSSQKEKIFKNIRIYPSDLAKVSDKRLSIEESAANVLSFQSLDRVSANFRLIDPILDIAGALRKPYKRSKRTPFDGLATLIERRHAVIHKSIFDHTYTDEQLQRDLHDLQEGVKRVYRMLTETYDWEFIDTWAA